MDAEAANRKTGIDEESDARTNVWCGCTGEVTGQRYDMKLDGQFAGSS